MSGLTGFSNATELLSGLGFSNVIPSFVIKYCKTLKKSDFEILANLFQTPMQFSNTV